MFRVGRATSVLRVMKESVRKVSRELLELMVRKALKVGRVRVARLVRRVHRALLAHKVSLHKVGRAFKVHRATKVGRERLVLLAIRVFRVLKEIRD